MKYTNIGNTNTKVSVIGLGTWQFGSKTWGYGNEFNKKDAINIVNRAIDLGVNLIDTAEIYGRGESERIIGEAIKSSNREDLILATKFFPKTIRPSAVIRALRRSLERLQTDYIDIYLIHWPNPILPIGRTLNNMETMVDEGLIHFIGVSNFSKGRLIKAQRKMKHYKIQINQVNYSIAKSGIENDLLPYAQNEQILVMAYSPLAQGWLTGKYSLTTEPPRGIRRMNSLFSKRNLKRGFYLLKTLKEISENHQVSMAQVALNWLVRNQSVVAIPGAKSIKQVENNIQSTEFELTSEEVDIIKKTIKMFHPRLIL